MDADAQLDAAVWRRVGISAIDLPLDLDRTAECIDDAGEFDEEPIAGRLDQPPAMRGDRRVYHLRADQLEPAEGAFLVGPDQTGITSDIGG